MRENSCRINNEDKLEYLNETVADMCESKMCRLRIKSLLKTHLKTSQERRHGGAIGY